MKTGFRSLSCIFPSKKTTRYSKSDISSPFVQDVTAVKNSGSLFSKSRSSYVLNTSTGARLPSEFRSANYTEDFERLATTPCMLKVGYPYRSNLPEQIIKEKLITDKLSHAYIIKIISTNETSESTLMQNGGLSLEKIAANTAYDKFHDYLKNTLKIDCKSYVVDVYMNNHYKNICTVIDELTEKYGKYKFSYRQLLETCVKKFPFIDVKSILQLNSNNDIPDLHEESDFNAVVQFLKDKSKDGRNNISDMIEKVLGEFNYSKLGRRFTLEDYLRHAKIESHRADLTLLCSPDNIFSYFINKNTSLPQRVMQHASGVKDGLKIDFPKEMLRTELDQHGLRTVQTFSLEEEFWILYQLSQAVSHIHSKDVAHTALTDGNILLDKLGRVRVINFRQALDSSQELALGELEAGQQSDLLQLRQKFNQLILSRSHEFAASPVGLEDVAQLKTLCASFTSAEQLQAGLATFSHLFPKWEGVPL
jgi:hypothetical protein